ncbi:MAG: hypothetical protein PVI28_00270 [Gammaproteobacteria bacterium]|jgi:hypothetical protein
MPNRAPSSAATLAIALTTTSLSGIASAGAFDGTTNLVCSAIDVVGCTDGPYCLEGQARAFELPQFMVIDFENNMIRATAESGYQETSPIRNADQTEKQMILQGVENHRGWTAAVDRHSGDLVVTSAGPGVSFIIYGACTTL